MLDPKFKDISLVVKIERWRRHKLVQKALQLRRQLTKTMKETVGEDDRAIKLGILAAATADAEALAEESRNNVKHPLTIKILQWLRNADEEFQKRKLIKETKKMFP